MPSQWDMGENKKEQQSWCARCVRKCKCNDNPWEHNKSVRCKKVQWMRPEVTDERENERTTRWENTQNNAPMMKESVWVWWLPPQVQTLNNFTNSLWLLCCPQPKSDTMMQYHPHKHKQQATRPDWDRTNEKAERKDLEWQHNNTWAERCNKSLDNNQRNVPCVLMNMKSEEHWHQQLEF